MALDVPDAASIAAAGRVCSTLRVGAWTSWSTTSIDYDYDQQAVTADLARVRRIIDTNLLGSWAVTERSSRPLGGLGDRHGDERRGIDAADGGRKSGLFGLQGRPQRPYPNPGGRAPRTADRRPCRLPRMDARPTWVAEGGRPVAEGARSILAAIDAPKGSTDTYTQDGQPVPW